MQRTRMRGSQRPVTGLDNLLYKLIGITTERFFIRIKVDVQMTEIEKKMTSVHVT